MCIWPSALRLELLRFLYDVLFHRTEDSEQFLLFSLTDFEFIQCRNQISHQRIKRGIGHAHASVNGLHVAPCVLAGAAAGLADLVDELHLKGGNIRLGKETIDPVVRCHAADKVINHSRYGFLSSQPLVQTLVSHAWKRHRRTPGGQHQNEQAHPESFSYHFQSSFPFSKVYSTRFIYITTGTQDLDCPGLIIG